MRSYKENQNNKAKRINEALQNDITWGDSWAGRLIASVFRMAKMGIDLVAIKRLEAQLENAITKDIVTKLKEENTEFKTLSTEVEDAAIRDILINCIKKDPSRLEKTLNDLKNKYGEERVERVFNNLPQEIKDILLALYQYDSTDDKTDNTVNTKEASKTIYIDMINNLKALHNILEYYDKIEIVDVLKKNDRINTSDIKKEDSVKQDTNKPNVINNNRGINRSSNRDKTGNNQSNDSGNMSQVTEILKYSDFIINERNEDTNKPLFSIRSNETHLIEAYNGLKKVINGLISKDKGLSVDSALIIDLINNSKNTDIKTNIKEMYKQVCQFLSSGVVSANKLYTENHSVINDKGKRSIMADKIARLAKKTSQFQKENLYGGLGNSLGNSLKSFNVSMNNIIKYFKEEKESVETLTNENFISDLFNGNKKNTEDLDNTINNKVEVSVDGNKVTILYNNEEINKEELIDKSSKETIENIQQKVNTLNIDDKVDEYIKVANIDCLEIVRVFNNAHKIIVKNNIPSFREGGKVNTTRANNWEKLDGSGFDPANPGGGPFRNKKLHMAWNDSVLKIMKKYDGILKTAKLVDDNGKIIKAQYPITKFMLDSLDDNKMFYKGHQAKYLSQHFGLKVPTTHGYEHNPFKEVDNKRTTKKDEVTNNEPVQKTIVKLNNSLSFETAVGKYKKDGIYRLKMVQETPSGQVLGEVHYAVGIAEYNDHILYKLSTSDRIIPKYVEGYVPTSKRDASIIYMFFNKNAEAKTTEIEKHTRYIDANTNPDDLNEKSIRSKFIVEFKNVLVLKYNGENCVATNNKNITLDNEKEYTSSDIPKLYKLIKNSNESIITFQNFKNNLK